MGPGPRVVASVPKLPGVEWQGAEGRPTAKLRTASKSK
jgi:hypothetical protein